MKLAGAAANRFLARPDPQAPGLLLYGADAMRVALKRQEVIAVIVGPAGAEEMRLTRIAGADLRRDPAQLSDAMRAQGFFPGPRAVLVEDAGDGTTAAIGAALTDWQAGDAQIVVTAGLLPTRSSLRKLFEGHPAAVAIAIYDDPPGPAEIASRLHAAGVAAPDGAVMRDLATLAAALDPGDLVQTVEKIALYKWQDDTPLTAAEIALCAPATIDADSDEILHSAAEGRQAEIGRLLQRLAGQGVTPVTLAIRALQHFRTLHQLAVAPDPATAASRLRPPLFGPRRERMLHQARRIGPDRLEQAIGLILTADLQLRSASRAPGPAIVERLLLNLARPLARDR